MLIDPPFEVICFTHVHWLSRSLGIDDIDPRHSRQAVLGAWMNRRVTIESGDCLVKGLPTPVLEELTKKLAHISIVPLRCLNTPPLHIQGSKDDESVDMSYNPKHRFVLLTMNLSGKHIVQTLHRASNDGG